MAIVTLGMVQNIWRKYYSGKGTIKTQLKSGVLPSKIQIQQGFQGLSDAYDAARPGFKAAMEAQMGMTLTVQQAQAFETIFLKLKAAGVL